MSEMQNEPAATPEPPYYAVIFTSRRTADDPAGYEQTARRMIELASSQPGFLGVETARSADGLGITVSYWTTLDSIARWKRESEHVAAQQLGRDVWYEQFRVRVCHVEREVSFSRR